MTTTVNPTNETSAGGTLRLSRRVRFTVAAAAAGIAGIAGIASSGVASAASPAAAVTAAPGQEARTHDASPAAHRPELSATITLPGGFTCANGRIQIPAPRIWASARTQQVAWQIQVQRRNPSTGAWYTYSTRTFYASFDVYGRNQTGWSGGQYVNSRMNIPVSHAGTYRVYNAVAVTDGSWSYGLVGGGATCTFR